MVRLGVLKDNSGSALIEVTISATFALLIAYWTSASQIQDRKIGLTQGISNEIRALSLARNEIIDSVDSCNAFLGPTGKGLNAFIDEIFPNMPSLQLASHPGASFGNRDPFTIRALANVPADPVIYGPDQYFTLVLVGWADLATVPSWAVGVSKDDSGQMAIRVPQYVLNGRTANTNAVINRLRHVHKCVSVQQAMAWLTPPDPLLPPPANPVQFYPGIDGIDGRGWPTGHGGTDLGALFSIELVQGLHFGG